MDNKQALTAYDIVDESIDRLIDKKRYNTEMTHRLVDAAKKSEIETATLRRIKDYKHYAGLGWVDGDPLILDPKEKQKDKLTPTFKKLLEIIDDCQQAGFEDLLTPYLKALSDIGITIDYSGHTPSANALDVQDCHDAVDYANTQQGFICSLADQIKEDGVQAEDLGFGPKAEYSKLINMAWKKKQNKDIDNDYQNVQADLLFKQQSYNDVKNDTINADPSKNPK